MKYFFILGNHPAMAYAEIESKFKQLKINAETLDQIDDFVIFEIADNIDVEKLQEQLAGTIKIGKIVDQIDKVNQTNLIKNLPASEKNIFGISTYGGLSTDIKKIGLSIKKQLKENSGHARFVSSKTNPLSSVIVHKNLLNKGGTELVILKAMAQLFIGQTLTVQPFNLFSKLDYGRPGRDDYSGMLPLKLAQTMINLSEAPLDGKILDPFCGSGTILQQALFLGYKNVSGSDASEKSIKNSKSNLAWYSELQRKQFNVAIEQKDATKIASKDKRHVYDAIITEPFLGPPIKGNESPEQLKHTIRELAKLYQAVLKQMELVLKRKGSVVMVVPEFRVRNKSYLLDIKLIMPHFLSVKKSWTYSRPDQKIIRHIYKLKRA